MTNFITGMMQPSPGSSAAPTSPSSTGVTPASSRSSNANNALSGSPDLEPQDGVRPNPSNIPPGLPGTHAVMSGNRSPTSPGGSRASVHEVSSPTRKAAAHDRKFAASNKTIQADPSKILPLSVGNNNITINTNDSVLALSDCADGPVHVMLDAMGENSQLTFRDVTPKDKDSHGTYMYLTAKAINSKTVTSIQGQSSISTIADMEDGTGQVPAMTEKGATTIFRNVQSRVTIVSQRNNPAEMIEESGLRTKGVSVYS